MSKSKEKFTEKREQEQLSKDNLLFTKAYPIDLSLVDVKNLTRQSIGRLSDIIIEKVNGGEIAALEAFIRVDFLQKILTKAKDAIKKEALDEADKYGAGDTLLSVQIGTAERGVKYDYSGNPEWCELKEKIDAVQKEMKQAALSKHALVTEDGEVITPAIKSSTTSIDLKYKNNE